MSILITGATGYLGKKLINEFDNKNDRIILTYRNKKPKIDNSFILKKFDFFEKSKKKDDLADCYLQAISYTKLFMK